MLKIFLCNKSNFDQTKVIKYFIDSAVLCFLHFFFCYYPRHFNFLAKVLILRRSCSFPSTSDFFAAEAKNGDSISNLPKPAPALNQEETVQLSCGDL